MTSPCAEWYEPAISSRPVMLRSPARGESKASGVFLSSARNAWKGAFFAVARSQTTWNDLMLSPQQLGEARSSRFDSACVFPLGFPSSLVRGPYFTRERELTKRRSLEAMEGSDAEARGHVASQLSVARLLLGSHLESSCRDMGDCSRVRQAVPSEWIALSSRLTM
jgi:hypothetical protein